MGRQKILPSYIVAGKGAEIVTRNGSKGITHPRMTLTIMDKKPASLNNISTTGHRLSLAILLASMALLLIHHHYFFYGYFGYDDMHYAKLSFELLHGHIDYSDHYSFRWPILALTTLSYYLFGVSDLAIALPSLVLSGSILTLIFLSLRKEPFVLAAAMLLFFSVRWNVFYSDKLMPDVYVSFFLFAAWLTYRRLTEKDLWKKSLLFALLLFLAFLSKGTVILIAPLLLYYLIRDIRAGKVKKWTYSLAWGTGFLLLYFTWIYALTEHPLSRFHAIEANSYLNPCSYDQMPFSETGERLTSGFARLVVKEGLIIFLIIPVIARIYAAFHVKDKSLLRDMNFHLATILVLFLSMNFMTFSLKSYNPGCLDIRHYLFSIPIMAVSTGHVLKNLQLSGWAKALVLIVLIGATVPTVKHMLYARTLKYAHTKNDILALIDHPGLEEKIIISNEVMINLLAFYSEYQFTDRLYTVENFDPDACTDPCYLISNWYTAFHANTDMDQMKKELVSDNISLVRDTVLTAGTKGVEGYRVVR